MATAVILFLAALGLWWAIVPLVHRFGLTIATPGGLIACASTAAAAALLAGGLAAPTTPATITRHRYNPRYGARL